tara:strand:+ start:516 stop:728 length:213 start_codon:yes stop_codon:yes gene_type:complete
VLQTITQAQLFIMLVVAGVGRTQALLLAELVAMVAVGVAVLRQLRQRQILAVAVAVKEILEVLVLRVALA